MSAQGTEFTEAIRELREVAELMYNSAGTKNTQTINVNAGGWGVLIALIMVAFLAGLNISQASQQAKMAAEMSDIRRRNDVANDKLSVILQWSPELAKKVDDSINQKGNKTP